jgi:hypothetical protein
MPTRNLWWWYITTAIERNNRGACNQYRQYVADNLVLSCYYSCWRLHAAYYWHIWGDPIRLNSFEVKDRWRYINSPWILTWGGYETSSKCNEFDVQCFKWTWPATRSSSLWVLEWVGSSCLLGVIVQWAIIGVFAGLVAVGYQCTSTLTAALLSDHWCWLDEHHLNERWGCNSISKRRWRRSRALWHPFWLT